MPVRSPCSAGRPGGGSRWPESRALVAASAMSRELRRRSSVREPSHARPPAGRPSGPARRGSCATGTGGAPRLGRGDSAALRLLYVPGSSAGAADVAPAAPVPARGLAVRGMRMQMLRRPGAGEHAAPRSCSRSPTGVASAIACAATWCAPPSSRRRAPATCSCCGGSAAAGGWRACQRSTAEPSFGSGRSSAEVSTSATLASAKRKPASTRLVRHGAHRAEQLGCHPARGGAQRSPRVRSGRPVGAPGARAARVNSALRRGPRAAEVHRPADLVVQGQERDCCDPVAQRDHREVLPAAAERPPSPARKSSSCCFSGALPRSITGAVRRMQTRAPASTAGSVGVLPGTRDPRSGTRRRCCRRPR